MKKTVILATAAALALGFAAQAEEQKVAPATASNTAAPAATTAAAPANTGAKVAEAAKPAPTTPATGTTVTEATKTTPTEKAPAAPTAPKTPEVAQTTVAFKVEGLNTAEEFGKLQNHLKKDLTKGITSFNCNAAVKECTATINPAQTNADAILTWAKTNKYNLMKK